MQHNLLTTFVLGLVGLAAVAFALLYRQDGYYTGLKWYQVLAKDLPVRIVALIVGLMFLSWAGFLQFKNFQRLSF